MSLSSEEMLIQSKVLTEATDTNPNMPFKSTLRLNKGLNPDTFSGLNSKIVNAINLLQSMIVETQNTAFNLNDKVNGVILDVDKPLNAEKWNSVKEILKSVDPTAESIIQALELLLQGKLQSNILGLSKEDNGKILSVFVDELGKVTTKAVQMTGSGSSDPVTAQQVSYTNPKFESLTTVAKALDYTLANLGTSEGPSGPITWDQILEKPDVPDTLLLNGTSLALNSKSIPLSSVPLANDEDITGIISSLDAPV